MYPIRILSSFRIFSTVVALLLISIISIASAHPATRSTSITMSQDGAYVYNVNHDANSVTVFSVKGGLQKLDEVPVGREPSCVAVAHDKAFVTNGASGTVSVIESSQGHFKVTAEVTVGTEPRGCALTPEGDRLYVVNLTSGSVSVIDTGSYKVVDTIYVGGRPMAIAIDANRVYITQFYARLVPKGPGEGFDDGKQAVVQSFPRGNPQQITETILSPLADSGFTANRAVVCKQLNPAAVNDTFCPDTTITNKDDPKIAQDPQAVFPNQLNSILACSNYLYLPNIGAQPEPPVVFNTNVQALVHVVNISTLTEQADLTVNLNAQIKTEPPVSGDPRGSLQRLFGNDIVAIDADPNCENFFIVSRGGNFVLKARSNGGRLDIGAPDKVVRFQTGNIPSGIVVDWKRSKAYVNNEVNLSVSILDLGSGMVAERDVPSGTPPTPGSHEDAVAKGKLTFFTALGVPENGLNGLNIRDIIPVQFRNKQSSDAWSTCASCHPAGLADGVTWIFPDGPRQSIPLDGLYSKLNGAHDTRINNWSAARDSVTDFNNNSRNVQCGAGFAGGEANLAIGCPPIGFANGVLNPAIFDHGLSQGASEALDVETTWALTVRAPYLPQPSHPDELATGAALFETNCASCHGGAKWTKSQVIYLNNPALDKAFAAGGTPRDPGLQFVANQSVSYSDAKVDPKPLKFLEDIGTFNAANPIEIRQNGAAPLGTLGFNVPSLLGIGFHAPYFHNGSAQTLEEVFAQHAVPGGGTIESALSAGDRAQLLAFLASIDGRTGIFTSDTDLFKDPTKNLP